MLWLSILVSWLVFIFIIFNGGYEATPLQAVKVPLLEGGSILHQRGRQVLSLVPLDMGGTYPFHFPCLLLPCLLWPSSMSGCIHHWVHYPPASTGTSITPSALHTCPFWGVQPHHITCGLHLSSVDAPVDVHGRSHNFPFIHPREALLVGHWMTTLPLFSCGIHFIPPLTEVVLCGVGLVHLSHVWQLSIHNICQPLMQEEEVGFGGGLVTFPVGLSLHKRGCLLQSDAPLLRSLLPTYPWSSSFP